MQSKKKNKIIKNTSQVASRAEPQVNLALLASFTEADIERMKVEDGEADGDFSGPGYLVRPGPNPAREAREKLGLSQDEFAQRFGLSVRTLQQWEQSRRVPDAPAALLLRVIAREPRAVMRVVNERRPVVREGSGTITAGKDASPRQRRTKAGPS
ncbi:MAG: helix-turn-helix domain-containing protein [Candidatus Eremiobacteraeota bacterium]|nr:helix-turn-helix domain-containing protein [Candidatus Eremiobacteraeota bacterium]